VLLIEVDDKMMVSMVMVNTSHNRGTASSAHEFLTGSVAMVRIASRSHLLAFATGAVPR
jgi:hypothetical protein